MGPLCVPELRALPAPPVLPAVEALVQVLVDGVEFPFAVSGPEVVPPSPDHGIERRDDLLHVARSRAARVGQVMDARADTLHRLERRPPLHEVPARVALDAPSLVDVPAEEVESLLAPTSTFALSRGCSGRAHARLPGLTAHRLDLTRQCAPRARRNIRNHNHGNQHGYD